MGVFNDDLVVEEEEEEEEDVAATAAVLELPLFFDAEGFDADEVEELTL